MIRPRLALALLAAFIAGCANEPTEPTPQVMKVAKPAGSHAASLGPYSPALNSSLDPAVTFSFQQPNFSRAYAINDAGLVVGEGTSDVAGVWTASGGGVVLGNLDGSTQCCSMLAAVNSHGDAVGHSNVSGGALVYFWSQSTNTKVNLGGLGASLGEAINDNGDVAGHDLANGGIPWFKPSGGAYVRLSTAPYPVAYITGMNNNGMVVGLARSSDIVWHAAAWPRYDAALIDLGGLGGDKSEATAINTAGDIVGWSEITPGDATRHAMLWPATGGMVDLTTWTNGCVGTSEAGGINAAGIIVGQCNGFPVLWTALQGMRQVSPSQGGAPTGINSHLQIVGIVGCCAMGLWQPAQSAQTITFSALGAKTFGDGDFTVSATASSGLTVSFSATGSCTVTGSTVHLAGAGSCTIAASQAGNASYLAAPNVARSFTIAPATPSLAWTPPVSMFWGTALSAVQLNATATGVGGGPLAGTFTYTPPAGTYLPAGPAQTLSVNFNPLDAVNYSPTSMTALIAVVYATPKTKDECKDGGWEIVRRADGSIFKNQGDCIQYVNTGK